jgi:catechol 2,3-dioxygenase
MESAYRIPSDTTIGHVHLKVADIDRALAFYQGVLGFDLVFRLPDNSAAFLAAGQYHHHVALNTWMSRGGSPAPHRHTGLYHLAVRYPSRRDLAVAVKRVIDAGVRLQGVADHGVSESIYLADPDGNGVELTRDRPMAEWPRNRDGTLALAMADPLDLNELLKEGTPADGRSWVESS